MGDIECDLTLTLDMNSAVIREDMKELAYQAYEKDEIAFVQMLDAADCLTQDVRFNGFPILCRQLNVISTFEIRQPSHVLISTTVVCSPPTIAGRW